MLRIFTISLLIFSLFPLSNEPEGSLFIIVENDKIGYIDSRGKVIIRPLFLNGNEFSEGLASVRRNGLYGFIDETGIFKIAPAFDFATRFTNGIATVYKKGEVFFIDKDGKTVLPDAYNSISFVNKNKAIVSTRSRKSGVIDLRSKQLVVDTLYHSISEFKDGMAIVTAYIQPSNKRNDERFGVIDTSGKVIVKPGKYKRIKPFYAGYAVVEIENKNNNNEGDTDGVIDTKGDLIFTRVYKNGIHLSGDFHEGLAKISLYKYWIPEDPGILYTTAKNYEGYINLKGKIVFNDTNTQYVSDFSSGRAFIKKERGDYILINKSFSPVGKKSYQDVLNDTFSHGYAIVRTEDGWGIIDTSANYVVTPQYDEIDRVGIIDGYFFYAVNIGGDDRKYGVAGLHNDTIVPPIMEDIDRTGFVNGLIKCIVDGRLSYINKKGKIVWQADEESLPALKNLNIDYMNRGYFYAYSSPKGSEKDMSGGWATSANIPKKTDTDFILANDKLIVKIDPSITDTFAGRFNGYSLLIINMLSDTIKFNAQDSRLDMKLQALNSYGEWRDIEYLPSSWCGNSYHQLALEPGAYWRFTIPVYEGELKTSIRAELKYVDKTNPKAEKIIYSNTIEGSVNPGQFWNKRNYSPNGIVDPYFD